MAVSQIHRGKEGSLPRLPPGCRFHQPGLRSREGEEGHARDGTYILLTHVNLEFQLLKQIEHM